MGPIFTAKLKVPVPCSLLWDRDTIQNVFPNQDFWVTFFEYYASSMAYTYAIKPAQQMLRYQSFRIPEEYLDWDSVIQMEWGQKYKHITLDKEVFAVDYQTDFYKCIPTDEPDSNGEWYEPPFLRLVQEVAVDSVLTPQTCQCDMFLLMREGCKCGGFKKEQEQNAK